MEEKRKLRILWVVLAALLLGGLVLGAKVGFLTPKAFGAGDITKLLGRFFVLALFVERTLEVFITAWRGKETVQRENELKAAKESVLLSPPDPSDPQVIKDKANWLAAYKCETQAIALRSALVLGILIAAVGVRSFNIFVEEPALPQPAQWFNQLQLGTFHVLDVLVSGGIIGGGSDAIHKMMNVITEFLDATASKMKTP
jgi:hypothetical protein